MALGQGSLAGLARVAFEAVTGDFNVDVERSERVYRDATRGMSDEAIRLELSQEKLRRALAKGPAAYREVARAELQVRQSERALRGETDSLGHSLDRTQRSLDRAGRGALLGSGAFRGLARSITFASASFLGGAGLVYGYRQALNAASNLEEQQNKVRVTFRDSGQEVIDWSRTSATSFGIAQDRALEYTGTLGGILNVSGLAREESAKLSRELVQLAADMASFNNASPEQTLEALRAGLVGESEPLRRFQILLSDARVTQEALRVTQKASKEELSVSEKVLARYRLIVKDTSDQQGDFARTSEGLANSQRTLSALWRDAQALVGQALAPSYAGVVKDIRDWLSIDANRIELQRQVNVLVKDGEAVARGFAGGLQTVVDVARPLVKALGGIGEAAETALILGVLLKARRAAQGLGLIAISSRAVSGAVVADMARMGAAIDVATRPRSLVITSTGVPVGRGVPTPVPVGRGGRAGGLVGTLAILGAAVFGPEIVDLLGGLSGPSPQEAMPKLRHAARRGRLTFEQLDQLATFLSDDQERELRGLIAQASARGAAQASGGIEDIRRRRAAERREPSRRRARPFTLADFERQFAALEERRIDAEFTPGTADDVRILREQNRLIQRALRELELTRDERVRLKQQRLAILDELARIEQEEEQAAAERRKKERERRRRAREREIAEQVREARRLDLPRAQRQVERFGAAGSFGGGLGAALIGARARRDGRRRDGERPLTQAELDRALFDWLSSLHGVIAQFGSNIAPDPAMGQVATHAYVQTELMREQNQQLERLSRGMWFPGTGYSRSMLSAAGFGVGF